MGSVALVRSGDKCLIAPYTSQERSHRTPGFFLSIPGLVSGVPDHSLLEKGRSRHSYWAPFSSHTSLNGLRNTHSFVHACQPHSFLH